MPPFAAKQFRPGPVQIPQDVLPADQYKVEGVIEHHNTKACGQDYCVKWLEWSLEEATV
jgi:hypothetical protein